MRDPKLTFLIRCAYGAVWLALIWLMVRYVLVWLLPFLIALALAALLTVPLGGIFGFLIGKLLNKMKGQEMIGSMILGYFANGLYQLLARLEVQTLYLPDIEDEYGVRERLLRLAEENGIEVVYVRRTVECPLGGAVLSLYPPVGEGDLNEQGLTALCSAGDFDVLITGDMAGSTERKLVGQYDLPDIEVLMVGHHGSRYSSSQELLQAVRPETAIISVGDNSYGHPTQEAMDRLSQAGAEIYRTDRQGNILVTVHGGD